MSSEQCSKPLLVDYLMGLYYPKISRGFSQSNPMWPMCSLPFSPCKAGASVAACSYVPPGELCLAAHTFAGNPAVAIGKSSSGTRREKRCWLQWFLHGIFLPTLQRAISLQPPGISWHCFYVTDFWCPPSQKPDWEEFLLFNQLVGHWCCFQPFLSGWSSPVTHSALILGSSGGAFVSPALLDIFSLRGCCVQLFEGTPSTTVRHTEIRYIVVETAWLKHCFVTCPISCIMVWIVGCSSFEAFLEIV